MQKHQNVEMYFTFCLFKGISHAHVNPCSFSLRCIDLSNQVAAVICEVADNMFPLMSLSFS